MGMRVQDVTPRICSRHSIARPKAVGHELIGMKVQDVTPEYIKALQSRDTRSASTTSSAPKCRMSRQSSSNAPSSTASDLTLQKLIQLRQLNSGSKADI